MEDRNRKYFLIATFTQPIIYFLKSNGVENYKNTSRINEQTLCVKNSVKLSVLHYLKHINQLLFSELY